MKACHVCKADGFTREEHDGDCSVAPGRFRPESLEDAYELQDCLTAALAEARGQVERLATSIEQLYAMDVDCDPEGMVAIIREAHRMMHATSPDVARLVERARATPELMRGLAESEAADQFARHAREHGYESPYEGRCPLCDLDDCEVWEALGAVWTGTRSSETRTPSDLA